MDFGSSALAGIGVGLELVAQDALLAAELTHVVDAALEERCGIHHTDTLPASRKHSELNRPHPADFTGSLFLILH